MPKIKEGFKGEHAIVLPAFLIDELKQDPLGKELYITDIGYYPHANYHYRERSSEEAKEFIFIYCVEGEGWFNLDDHKYNVTANHFFILPENKAHAYGSNSDNPWTIYWMHFNGVKAAFFSTGFNQPGSIALQEELHIKEKLTLFDDIYSSVASGYSKNYMLYATTALFHLLGTLKFMNECRKTSSNSASNDIAQIAIHFMQENLSKPIRLAEIAAKVKLSASYFSYLFEQKTGSSPLRYFTYLRIQEACHYLDFTNLKVNQISPLVGYEDPLYFSRLFTKIMGMPPSVYKERQKG